ncbi:MAG: DUF2083 domain-containing protein [Acetobacteraceae bacterium]|nr:DUF2083 domain-containing protein [Acetobacteraceae bacterium]
MAARSPKLFAGTRLRLLREKSGLSQAALARSVGLSPSYLNQIEHDERPLPGRVMHRLCALFAVGPGHFGDAEMLRGAHDLREVTADPMFGGTAVAAEEVHAAVQAAPEVARRFLSLYRAYRAQAEELAALRETGAAGAVAGGPAAAAAPYDEVRDWVQSHRNHFDALDRSAEDLFDRATFAPATLREDLARRLRAKHGITVADDASLLEEGSVWRLERGAKRLLLAQGTPWESRVFWMAHILGQLEYGPLIDREVRRASLSTEEARSLARVGLANYFAGALMMPYRRFLTAAQETLYDVERLQSRFNASFEQICHRLSTMQRPGLPGIPFFFVKTDIAGNVLKRSSATRFQFARFGGPCPLWNVYRAFASPGQILVQLATTPDDVTYVNVARTVSGTGGFYLSRPRSVAVVLGCEVQYATQTVYAAGLDLHSLQAAVPIGPGCRACERSGCRHRAVPPVGRALDVGTGERGVVPYRIRALG